MYQDHVRNIRSESAGISGVYGDAVDGEEKTGSAGFWKFFKWFIIIASLALAVELVWFLGITPFRPFSKIEIKGFSYYKPESLLLYAGITSRSSYIFTDARETESRIATLPRIESVRVIKRFPGRLEIHLEGRTATAVSFVEAGGVTIPIVFDREGIIFQVGVSGLEESLSGMPVVSGMEIEKPVPGAPLPARYFSFLEDLDSIQVNAPELLSSISEIHIGERSPEGFDLTLFLLHHKIRVRLSVLNEEQLRYTLLMADVLKEREPEIDLIDFRGAMASYYPKGGGF